MASAFCRNTNPKKTWYTCATKDEQGCKFSVFGTVDKDDGGWRVSAKVTDEHTCFVEETPKRHGVKQNVFVENRVCLWVRAER